MKVRGSFRARTTGLLATSTAAHLVLFAFLGLIPTPSEAIARHEMEFEVVSPPKPEEPPPPPPPPPPEPEKPKEPARAPKAAAPEPEDPPPEDTPPPAEEVADFTGTTLTAASGSGWSTVVGSGAPIKGPLGKISRGQSEKNVQQGAKAVQPGPRVVAINSLSRKPQAPGGLDSLLEQNYPRRARMQGVEGRVVVALRVLPTGRVAQLHVLQEFPGGFDFGTACRQTLMQAPPFVAPLDRDGKPVASDIKFTCSFVVDY